MKKHIYKIRVRYAEVDQMGVVYYGNYLAYLEAARAELLRDEGYPYARMEAEGIFLPVVECRCQYKGSARYDEEILVETTIGYVRNASIKINYKVFGPDNKKILTGYTIHPFVDAKWKIIGIPDDIKHILSGYLES